MSSCWHHNRTSHYEQVSPPRATSPVGRPSPCERRFFAPLARDRAVHFSLIASCLRQAFAPVQYLRDVFTRWPPPPAGNPTHDDLRCLQPAAGPPRINPGCSGRLATEGESARGRTRSHVSRRFARVPASSPARSSWAEKPAFSRHKRAHHAKSRPLGPGLRPASSGWHVACESVQRKQSNGVD